MTKIWAVNGALVGSVGTAVGGLEMREWYRNGALPEEFPASQRDDAKCSNLLVILPNFTILKYEHAPYPIHITDAQIAIGCGRDFALAAMHLGKTAAEAVKVACRFDSGCGNGVDTLVHGEGI